MDNLIDSLSDELYWLYKDIWDGYIEDENALFRELRHQDRAIELAAKLGELWLWGQKQDSENFENATNKISSLTDHVSKHLGFLDWLKWAHDALLEPVD